MENDCVSSFLVGFNTPSPVMKRRRVVDWQANATSESLLHNSPPKTDEDVAIYDALEKPRCRTRMSPKTPGSGYENLLVRVSGSSSSSSSGGSNRRTSPNTLNPGAREFKPAGFAHSGQELRDITNLSRSEIHRLSGGSSGEQILPPSPAIYPSFVSSPIPNLYLVSPLPSPTNYFYHPLFENSPEAPSPMAPPQPPFLVEHTPETTPHKPTTTIAKSKSPVTLNLPSEPVKSKPSRDESTSDASLDLPSALITVQPPLCLMEPLQPPFLVSPTPETTPQKPTATSTPKGKSPVTLNLPSEPVKCNPSVDESTSDATLDLPSALVTVQHPLYSDWVPLDDGIECALPPGLTRNETRVSALLSANSTQSETPESTLASAGSIQNETQSTLPYGSTQSGRPDNNLAYCSTDQNQAFSREELNEYINTVLYEVRPRKRLPVFENITTSEISVCLGTFIC